MPLLDQAATSATPPPRKRGRPRQPPAQTEPTRPRAARAVTPTDELTLNNTLSLPIKTACRVTGFSADAMYDLIRAGAIQSFTMGHRRFLIVQSIRDYLA